MVREAEVYGVRAIVEVRKANRPSGAPAQVVQKGGKPVDLKILAEGGVEAKQRPCVALAADAGDQRHPRIYLFTLAMETVYPTDDFDELDVVKWQSALAGVIDDRATVRPLICEALQELESPWQIRDIKPAPGGSEVDGQRGRNLTDRWNVWMWR